MQLQKNGKTYYCPVEAALDVIGGNWKPLILWHLKDDVRRFSGLQDDSRRQRKDAYKAAPRAGERRCYQPNGLPKNPAPASSIPSLILAGRSSPFSIPYAPGVSSI